MTVLLRNFTFQLGVMCITCTMGECFEISFVVIWGLMFRNICFDCVLNELRFMEESGEKGCF